MKLDLGIMAGAESKQWLQDMTKLIERMESAVENLRELSVNEKTDVAPKRKVGAHPALGAPYGKQAAPDEEDKDAGVTEETEEDEDFPAKAPVKKKNGSFDDDDEEEADEEVESVETDEDDDAGFATAPPPPAKLKGKAKPKKLTIDDVNDACKARAMATGGAKGRSEVLAILKKKFKTETVSDLKPEQFVACIAAMSVDQ